MVNQARMNPQAAAVRVTSNLTPDVQSTLDYYHVDLNAAKQAIANSPAKPPLAWNPSLATAAQAHTQDMVANAVPVAHRVRRLDRRSAHAAGRLHRAPARPARTPTPMRTPSTRPCRPS